MNKIFDSMLAEIDPAIRSQAVDLIVAINDAISYLEYGGSAHDQTELLDELRTAVANAS